MAKIRRIFMDNETMELIELLNNIKSNQEDGDKIVKINNIIYYRNAIDIKNGMPYLNDIIKDQEVEKHLKYRKPQDNFNMFGQPITEAESFVQNCNAVIIALSKSIIEDKVKGEYKKQLRPDFQNFIELVEFYKNIIKD